MTKDEVIAKGYKYYCMDCHKIYKQAPYSLYEDGHGGRQTLLCSKCGCDLIVRLCDDTLVE